MTQDALGRLGGGEACVNFDLVAIAMARERDWGCHNCENLRSRRGKKVRAIGVWWCSVGWLDKGKKAV
jgi:hypothetical protein